jgi:hypothetical protein
MAMLKSKKAVSRGQNKPSSSTFAILTVPALAIAGLLTTILPDMAIAAASKNNDYGACAANLLKTGITAEAAAQGCAQALRPRDLASCVVKINELKINKQTLIPGADALNYCGKARRPEDLASCVVDYVRPNLQVEVDLNQNLDTEEKVNQAALDYCGRSLLPQRFGLCVKGLRKATKLTSRPVLDTCIDGSDSSVIGTSSSSTPPNLLPAGSTPSLETTPFPTQQIVPTQPGSN